MSVCAPLTNVSELLAWRHLTTCIPAIVPLQPRSRHSLRGSGQFCHQLKSRWSLPWRYERSSVPSTLFCHDLRGGYLEDRFIHGSDKHNEYRFFHWACIDIFVYFSHNFVTIPPAAWINAAHLHGVKVLGTIITEWEDGAIIWNDILSNDDSIELFVTHLTDICKSYRFEGYLLNIENEIDPGKVKSLVKFVKLLHTQLHKEVPAAKLIWYDSATIEGRLNWQNELNDLNRAFFDNCDGIYLNYSWSEKELEQSMMSASVRMLDVFVGVDVFGRNCYSGGGFNTFEAVKLIQQYNLSLALFAPSWVHECLDQAHFTCLEYIFWKKLWPHLYIHGPAKLPFTTTFCQGYGKKEYRDGKVIRDVPWYNLSKQQYQPSVASCLNDCCIEMQSSHAENEQNVEPQEVSCENRNKGCVQHYSEDGFLGGGCLEVQRLSLTSKPEDPYFHRLMMCDFTCSGQIIVSVATKNNDEERTDVDLVFLIEENTGRYTMKMLFADATCDNSAIAEDSKIYPLQHDRIQEFSGKMHSFPHYESTKDSPLTWRMRHHLLDVDGRILEIGMMISGRGNSALLGYLGIVPLLEES